MPSDPAHSLKQLRGDYTRTFKTPSGRRALRDLMRRFHITSPHLSRDPISNAVAEGQRSVVLHIFTMLRLSEADIDAMMMRQPTMYDEEDL